MSSKTYWEKREAEALKHYLQEEQEYQAQLRAIYQNMLDAAQKEIDAFYGRYADKEQITRLVIAQYLTEIREAGVDTLILGCTHYPLLKTMIGEFMGRNVVLVDPAKTAAHHLERILSERGLKGNHPAGEAHFYVSDVPDSFAQTADLFLGEYKGGPIEQIAIETY